MTDAKLNYTPDKKISVHQESAIRQLIQHFGSHGDGLPELAKNSADAYIRENIAQIQRNIILIFEDRRRSHPASISCLDFVGMNSTDIEQYFRRWADPEASDRGMSATDVQGGHGHGGKAYMVQMFNDYAYLCTVKDNKGCKYGVPGGDIRFGYIPNRQLGRNFKVSDLRNEITEMLAEVRVEYEDLPVEIKDTIDQSQGFTLVRGVNPKEYEKRIPVPHLVEKFVNHQQMVRTLQICNVYVIANGSFYNSGEPLSLPEIKPLPQAEGPREVSIPEEIPDPLSRKKVSTTKGGEFPSGKLLLHTSEKSMRWAPRKYRHSIRYVAKSGYIGETEMTEFAVDSVFTNYIYGECCLDSLEEYKQSDRRHLTESPLTRALKDWISGQIREYCRQFERRKRKIYNQKQKDELSRMNAALDQWKNQFLEEMVDGLEAGDSPGKSTRRSVSLPSGTPKRIELTASHSRAGLGIYFKPKVKFFDGEGGRIRSVPIRWISSDTNVAMFDDEVGMVHTFSYGTTQIHVETMDGRLRSNPIPLEVVNIHKITIEPKEVEVTSGSRQGFDAVCTLDDGETSTAVFLSWIMDDDSIARVSSAGLVYGFEPGKTSVYAGDDRCISEPAKIIVLPSQNGAEGTVRGRSYPRILISGIDKDPVTDEEVPLTRDTPPVWQRPIDSDRNIWWINSEAPLANLYLNERKGFGHDSREWRVYLLERYVEIMAKIKLTMDYRQGEDVSMDYWVLRWDEISSQIQKEAVNDLQRFLEEGSLPGD
jgi:hypothetical protein